MKYIILYYISITCHYTAGVSLMWVPAASGYHDEPDRDGLYDCDVLQTNYIPSRRPWLSDAHWQASLRASGWFKSRQQLLASAAGKKNEQIPLFLPLQVRPGGHAAGTSPSPTSMVLLFIPRQLRIISRLPCPRVLPRRHATTVALPSGHARRYSICHSYPFTNPPFMSYPMNMTWIWHGYYNIGYIFWQNVISMSYPFFKKDTFGYLGYDPDILD